MKIAVVYWSGTGNTQAMAQEVFAGASGAGAQAELFAVSDFDAAQAGAYDALAFGCPSMGSEQLEDTEFEPVFEACRPALAGKKVALFGSYGWGDGEWMRNWAAACRGDGAVLAGEPVICNGAPEDDTNAALRALGAALV